jgi:hypothetical protein
VLLERKAQLVRKDLLEEEPGQVFKAPKDFKEQPG